MGDTTRFFEILYLEVQEATTINHGVTDQKTDQNARDPTQFLRFGSDLCWSVHVAVQNQ